MYGLFESLFACAWSSQDSGQPASVGSGLQSLAWTLCASNTVQWSNHVILHSCDIFTLHLAKCFHVHYLIYPNNSLISYLFSH